MPDHAGTGLALENTWILSNISVAFNLPDHTFLEVYKLLY